MSSDSNFFVKDDDAADDFFVKDKPPEFSAKRTAQNSLGKGYANVFSIPHNVLSALALVKEHFPFVAPGTDSLIEKGLESTNSYEQQLEDFHKKYPEVEKPETPGEEAWSNIGGASLGNAPFGPEGMLIGALGQGAEEAAKALGAPEPVQKGANLLASVLTGGRKLLTKAVTKNALRRSLKGDPERLALYDFARSQGLNDDFIAPMLQSETKKKFLGKFAKNTEKAQRTLEAGKDAAGDIYDELAVRGKAGGPMNPISQQRLAQEFEAIHTEMERTLAPSDDKQAAMNYIKKAIKRLYSSPVELDYLINFSKDINSHVNWNAIRNGKKSLESLKKPLQDTVSHANPQLGEDFIMANKLYGRAAEAQKMLGVPKNVENLISFGEAGILLKALFTLEPTLATGVVTTDLARRVGTKLLMDPKWQGLHKSMVKAIEQNKPGSVAILYKELQRRVEKEFPEESKDVKWPELETGKKD